MIWEITAVSNLSVYMWKRKHGSCFQEKPNRAWMSSSPSCKNSMFNQWGVTVSLWSKSWNPNPTIPVPGIVQALLASLDSDLPNQEESLESLSGLLKVKPLCKRKENALHPYKLVSETPIFVPGVWGPYFSAMVPGLWLNEGGQSATGKLIDHVVRGHVAFPELEAKAAASAHSIYTYLNSHLDLIKKSLPVGFLTVDLHVWPDFHGNRSPLTDLTLKGMVVGLTLSRGLDELALIYLATIQAIALGTRHILEAMQAAGHEITTLFLCGGLSKNPLFVQMHADITGKPVVLSKEVESVLVGAAILGACASGDFASIQ
ncbi:hypothetical protein DV515_00004682, partial [Chloebia gouldiae]